MEIMELAAELGKKIKADPSVARYNTANETYENDKELQALISEYNTQRAALETEQKKDAPDKSFVDIIESRIETLYNDIVFNPVFAEFTEAKEAVDEIMHRVYSELTFQITGERPCEPDKCASCGGCH